MTSYPPRSALDLIARHEGFRQFPYCDKCGEQLRRFGTEGWICACGLRGEASGNITIGYGLNLEATGLSRAQALGLLGAATDVLMLHDLKRLRFFRALDEVRAAAIVDLAYNLGVAGLLKFEQMIAALSYGHFAMAADFLRDSKAREQEPRRIEELAQMLETGEWPAGPY